MVIGMPEGYRSGTIITIFSTASASGKTLVSTNMAAGLMLEGYRVCLIDFDLQFGDVCNYLHLEPKHTLADAQRAAEENQTDFSVREFLQEYRYEKYSFSVLPAPQKIEDAYNISTDAMHFILDQLCFEFDYILIDTATAFSELNLMAMDMSNLVLFLGIMDFIPTIKNMKIGYDTMRSIGYDANKIRMVLNRSDSKTYIDMKDVEQLLQQPFYHVLSNDFMAAKQSIRDGIPLLCISTHTQLAEELVNMLGRLTNQAVSAEADEDGLFSWMGKIFK